MCSNFRDQNSSYQKNKILLGKFFFCRPFSTTGGLVACLQSIFHRFPRDVGTEYIQAGRSQNDERIGTTPAIPTTRTREQIITNLPVGLAKVTISIFFFFCFAPLPARPRLALKLLSPHRTSEQAHQKWRGRGLVVGLLGAMRGKEAKNFCLLVVVPATNASPPQI